MGITESKLTSAIPLILLPARCTIHILHSPGPIVVSMCSWFHPHHCTCANLSTPQRPGMFVQHAQHVPATVLNFKALHHYNLWTYFHAVR